MSNAHSEVFCQRTKVAMRAQCVLLATTLLHSCAKFHSFLYTGSKTVRVSMEHMSLSKDITTNNHMDRMPTYRMSGLEVYKNTCL